MRCSSIVKLFVVFSYHTPAAVGEDRAPRITEHPADILVRKNEPVTLGCHAEGLPQPTLRWYKDSRPLDPEGRHPLVLPAGGLFFLRVVPGKDQGVYWCEASNRAGLVRSRNATLSIAVLREEFKQEPRDTKVTRGQTAVLQCDPPRGHPEPSLHWRKDGDIVDLHTSSRLRLVDGSDLMISDARPGDAGQYQCVVQNMVGLRESSAASLMVHVKPYLTTAPRDVALYVNTTLWLHCRASGDPSPTVRWSRDSGTLSPRAYVMENNTLAITSVRVQERGVYVCEAASAVGAVTAYATVTVYDPPRFTIRPEDQTVQSEKLAEFQCKAEGFPTPDVFWTVEGSQELMTPGYSRGNYHVTAGNTLSVHAVADLSDVLVCAAVSEAGADVVRAHLQVEEEGVISPPPSEATGNRTVKPPGRPLVNDVTQNTVTLSWTPSRDFTTSTLYSVLYYSKPFGWMTAATEISSTNILITDLKPATVYAFAVFAEDTEGVSEPSVRSEKVQTLSQNARKVTLNQLNSARASLSEPVLQLKQLISTSSTSVKVIWQMLIAEDYVEGIYLHYQALSWNASGQEDVYRSVTVMNAGATSYTVTGLQKYSQYRVFLVPFFKTIEGRPSNCRVIETLEDEPSAAPQSLEVAWLNGTSAFVHWAPPPLNELNGNLLGYKVQVRANGRVLATMSVNSSTTSISVHHASPYVSVRVCALTHPGPGPYTPSAVLGPLVLNPPSARPTGPNVSQTLLMLTLLVSAILCALAYLTLFYLKRRQSLTKDMSHCVNNIGDLSQMSLMNACKDPMWIEGSWVSLQAYQQPLAATSAANYSTPSLSTFYSGRKDNPTPYATTTLVNKEIPESEIFPMRQRTCSLDLWPKPATETSHCTTLPTNAIKSQVLIPPPPPFAAKSTSHINQDKREVNTNSRTARRPINSATNTEPGAVHRTPPPRNGSQISVVCQSVRSSSPRELLDSYYQCTSFYNQVGNLSSNKRKRAAGSSFHSDNELCGYSPSWECNSSCNEPSSLYAQVNSVKSPPQTMQTCNRSVSFSKSTCLLT